MVESWRRKQYYPKRIIIDVDSVLDSPFPDTLICLTGQELAILRNLMAYAHRRSTFAAERFVDFYAAPTTEQWDALQAICADIERKIMGCDEIQQLLQDMLVQLQCICQRTSKLVDLEGSAPPTNPALDLVVKQYTDTGDVQTDDPYPGVTVPDIERCAIAQLTYYLAWETTTEVLQPVAVQTIEILMPIAMVLIATATGSLGLGIPVGAILAMLWSLIDVSIEGSVANVQNAIFVAKEELICAVYNGLTIDYREAQHQAYDVIDDMSDLSALDKVALKMLFAPWVMAMARIAYINDTDWAQQRLLAGYCDVCDWKTIRVWNFPPCPGDWMCEYPCSDSNLPGINQDYSAFSPQFTLPSIEDNIDIEGTVSWYSSHPKDGYVGHLELQYEDEVTGWQSLCGLRAFDNPENQGRLNTLPILETDKAVPRNVLRVAAIGQAGQVEENPFPCELVYVRIEVTPTTP